MLHVVFKLTMYLIMIHPIMLNVFQLHAIRYYVKHVKLRYEDKC